MKNLKYILLSLVAVVFMASCEKLLKEDPKYTQNSSVIFSSATNAEQALLGCYGYMTTTNAYGQMWQEVPIAMSGLACGMRNGSDQDLMTSLALQPSSVMADYPWTGMYKVIAEANAYISSIESSSIDEAVRNQYAAEAKFLRAVCYYNLATHFGDVPLKTTASSSDGIAIPRTDRQEVYNQVVTDLTEAIEALPETSEDGRANLWAAKAYLAKTYHMMARLGYDASTNYNNAKTLFDEVYASGKYALESSYANLWGDHVNGSSEAIFQLNFNIDNTTCFNRGSNRFAHQASTAGIAWGTYYINKWVVDLHYGTYIDDPRIPYTYQSAFRTRGGNNKAEPKAQVGTTLCANDSTYMYPYFTHQNGQNVEGAAKETKLLVAGRIPYEYLSDPTNPSVEELNNYSGPGINQYVNNVKKLAAKFSGTGNKNWWPVFEKMYDQQAVGTRDHHNLMVYRYAEMLMLMADTYNELGNTSKAVSLVNEVLTRARNTKKGAVQPANWSSSLSATEFTEKLAKEFIFEFAGEPNNFESLRMFGVEIFRDLLQHQNDHEITILGDAAYQADPGATIADRVLENGGTISTEFAKKNLLLPIPQTEIDANADISENNYGY